MATPKTPAQTDLVESTPETQHAAALRRGITEEQLPDLDKNTFWAISNRVDDVVVIWEQDPRHPGGEAFIGGGTPDLVYNTPAIARLVYEQMIKKVPEPAREIVHQMTGEKMANPLHLLQNPEKASEARGLPGQAIQLGRELDPKYWDQGVLDAHAKDVTEGRREIASEAEVPSDAPGERRT